MVRFPEANGDKERVSDLEASLRNRLAESSRCDFFFWKRFLLFLPALLPLPLGEWAFQASLSVFSSAFFLKKNLPLWPDGSIRGVLRYIHEEAISSDSDYLRNSQAHELKGDGQANA
jgi:hypothetical protein